MPLAVALLSFRPPRLGAQFPAPLKNAHPPRQTAPLRKTLTLLRRGRRPKAPTLRERATIRGAGNCAPSPHAPQGASSQQVAPT
ncbi:hypothetical protein SBRY_70190 [Actinacidiphila bryophytorum]|uniref:Uncharacterized protein n=1 Tax=Actinacidiphila bryophytorum TaxID=1436133 RepID=A0A9W4H778_9ACTN|nr:hypothetical protein SBRY_70190 [Actinacidiphila bryophytorum]